MMFSHREDVTLANPIAPPARGWEQVAATMEHAALNVKDDEISGFETAGKCVPPENVYVVWIERNEGGVGGSQDIVPFPLRVTTIFRPEDGTWKVVHRRADTVTSSRPIESLIQE
jgi:ketosteroid isomerase-like protein